MKIPVFFHITIYIAGLKKIAMSVLSNIMQPYSLLRADIPKSHLASLDRARKRPSFSFRFHVAPVPGHKCACGVSASMSWEK